MLVMTLSRHGYGGRIHVPGEEYEIEKGKHVKLLEAVGKIRRVPEAVVVAPPKEKPKPAKKKTAKKKTATKKKSGNTYKRKDMRSE